MGLPKGSYENEDLRPPTKTKTHYENEDLSPPYENEIPLRKRRHITKTSTKEVDITFVDKDYFHKKILNSEFGTSIIYYGIFQQ